MGGSAKDGHCNGALSREASCPADALHRDDGADPQRLRAFSHLRECNCGISGSDACAVFIGVCKVCEFRVTDHGWRVVHPGRYRRCFQNLFTIMRSVDNPPFEGRLIMTTILEPLFHEVYVNETLYMYGPPIIVELVE